jgi:hypothetical protein
MRDETGQTRYETPYIGPLEAFSGYDPVRNLGDAATAAAACPSRPLWWLVAAAAAGGLAGFALTKKDKRGGRRGRIE